MQILRRLLMRVLLVLLVVYISYASPQETLPTYTHDYDYISVLQDRGYGLDLSMLDIPYSKGQLSQSLLSDFQHITSVDPFVKNVAKRLLMIVNEEAVSLRKQTPLPRALIFNTYLNMDLVRMPDNHIVYRGIYRFSGGIHITDHLFVCSGVSFNQYDYHDPLYDGYKWRGVAGYTEQAYLSYAKDFFHMKLGRDFLRWGTGQTGTLLFSNNAQPFDQFSFSFNLGKVRYSFIIGEFDQMFVDSISSFIMPIRRFLAGHRLDFHLLDGKLQAGVSEIVVYGGVGKEFNFTYLNPFIFYHGAKKNGAGDNNVLPAIDVVFFPTPNLHFYSSLLIDDIQVEKTGSGDLEPNEIGWIFSSRWADPFRLSGTTLSTEYVRIANRTYKTPYPWETFIYKNRPLGHPLGNDFDLWQVGIDQWFGADLFFNLSWSQIRKGEGSLYTPWDEPWMNYTVEEGYSEPFPTGIVEKRQEISFKARYLPSIHWGVEGDVLFQNRQNADHVDGVTKDDVSWRLGVWYHGDFKMTF